jgi:Cu-Zn family superoxide dismutase
MDVASQGLSKETQMKTRMLFGAAGVACALAVLTMDARPQAGYAKEGIAVISPASGSNCKGVVRFTDTGNRMKVLADIEGLAPGSKHGFHVHEFGDCSAPDATSAGSHYDPAGTKHHGSPSDQMKHPGDLGNIEADSAGKAHYEITIQGVTIDGATAPILGRAVIVHANPDDFSQPVGNAGGRIGCGVIGIPKPGAK